MSEKIDPGEGWRFVSAGRPGVPSETFEDGDEGMSPWGWIPILRENIGTPANMFPGAAVRRRIKSSDERQRVINAAIALVVAEDRWLKMPAPVLDAGWEARAYAAARQAKCEFEAAALASWLELYDAVRELRGADKEGEQ